VGPDAQWPKKTKEEKKAAKAAKKAAKAEKKRQKQGQPLGALEKGEGPVTEQHTGTTVTTNNSGKDQDEIHSG